MLTSISSVSLEWILGLAGADACFAGVWDAVSSVGFLLRRSLPFSFQNDKTRVFRHALALDERRGRFLPKTWRYSTPERFRFMPWLDHLRAVFRYVSRDRMKGKKPRSSAQRRTVRKTDIKEVRALPISLVLSMCLIRYV